MEEVALVGGDNDCKKKNAQNALEVHLNRGRLDFLWDSRKKIVEWFDR